MVLDFLNAIVTQSAFLVSFKEAVDKIDALRIPVWREVFAGDFGLMGQNFVSDLFSGIAHVRAPAQNYFVNDNSECKIVRLKGMIHSADDFRRHVARGAAGFF